jgi:hypothetical protein
VRVVAEGGGQDGGGEEGTGEGVEARGAVEQVFLLAVEAEKREGEIC